MSGKPGAGQFVERGKSAQSIAARPAFRELLAYIEAHPDEIDYVIVYNRGRAFRNYDDAPEVEIGLRKLGIEVVSATENFSQDPDIAVFEKFVKDWTNAKMVKDNGRDIAMKMLHKAERGGFNGRAKLGYLNDKIKVDGYFVNTITVDPERAPLVRWAFDAYASGNYSLPRLQRELEDLGLLTRATAAFKAQPVSTSQLARILRDPTYTGVILFNGSLYPGRHEPIISKALFLRVQEVLDGRVRRGLRDRVHHHYLRGLLLCSRCEQKGVRSQLVFTQAEGNGGIYEYYFCARRKSGECDLPYVNLSEVEAVVEDQFSSTRLSPETVSELRRDIQVVLSDHQAADKDLKRSLQLQLKQLEGKEDRLIALVEDGDLPVGKLKARLQAVTLQREHLRERLHHVDLELGHALETIEVYLDLLSQPGRLYERAEDLVRRQLLEAFYPPLHVDVEDRVSVGGQPHPAIQALRAAERPLTEGKSTNEAGPGLSAGTRFVDAVLQFFDLLRPVGSNKRSLVAGTGFEPATSGL